MTAWSEQFTLVTLAYVRAQSHDLPHPKKSCKRRIITIMLNEHTANMNYELRICKRSLLIYKNLDYEVPYR